MYFGQVYATSNLELPDSQQSHLTVKSYKKAARQTITFAYLADYKVNKAYIRFSTPLP